LEESRQESLFSNRYGDSGERGLLLRREVELRSLREGKGRRLVAPRLLEPVNEPSAEESLENRWTGTHRRADLGARGRAAQ